jgi:carboxymethylenebutenolidase
MNVRSFAIVVAGVTMMRAGEGLASAQDPHAAHLAAEVAMQATTQAAAVPRVLMKKPTLPAADVTATATMAKTPRRGEWVDIPVGSAKLKTWISYPRSNDKAPIVVVIHGAPGMDDWVRGIADQLASEGFVALAPDLLSGRGPNGGNADSFAGPDDVGKAISRLTKEEVMRRLAAARDYGLKLPGANGQSASFGFCWGGGQSFSFASEVPDLNVAIVYYGTPPDAAGLAKIKAPVLGLYAGNDARVNATVEPAVVEMKRLGKATEDSWPIAVAFLKQHTR